MFRLAVEVGPESNLSSWLGERFNTRYFPPYTAIGILRGDEIAGVCLFHNYTGNDVELTVYAPGALSRRVLSALARFVFIDNHCDRITCFTRTDNHRAQRAMERSGFVKEGVRRKFDDGCDCIMFGLLKEDCRWLK